MNFSIIIINYNLSDEVNNCINSLLKNLDPSDFEIILVDNNSDDKSIIDIAARFSSLQNIKFTFLRTEINLGFGIACNLAAQQAANSILFFLNPDTLINNNILERLKNLFENSDDLGIVGLNVNENEIMDFSAGFFPNYFFEFLNILSLGRIAEAIYVKLKVKFSRTKILDVNWVMGAALFIYKKSFDLVKGFDPQYFLYFEEMDLCKKIIDMGLSVKYIANVKVEHLGSVSSKKNYYFFTKMIYKGKLLFFKKHFSKKTFATFGKLMLAHIQNQILLWKVLKLKNEAKAIGKIKAFNEIKTKINSPEQISSKFRPHKNIAINLFAIRSKIAGGGKYAQKIVEELSKIDFENHYFLFLSEKAKINFKIKSENFHLIVSKFNPESVLTRILWEQFILPFKLFQIKPEIIFTPTVAFPFLYKGNFFTTIHDLAYKSKTKYTFLRRKYVKLITKISAQKSKILFTVSNFSKKEIENEFRLRNKKIVITYNGVEDIFFKTYSTEEKLSFINKYSLSENFILYVGAIEPGKNLDKLFIAFSILLKIYKYDIKLVITSGIGWSQDIVLNQLGELRIREKVIFLPYIEENELPLLYKTSKMLAYLSNYEGFGIPVLEAIASETPVLTSQSEAIQEFAGNSVVSTDPDNIDEIVSNMMKILTDTDFVSSKIKEGKNVAQKFQWKNSARIIYDQIIHFNA